VPTSSEKKDLFVNNLGNWIFEQGIIGTRPALRASKNLWDVFASPRGENTRSDLVKLDIYSRRNSWGLDIKLAAPP